MATFVIRAGELVPKHLAAPLHEPHGSGAYVISDDLDYVQCPADGQRYTSKSRYYEAVRRAGCVIVGNEDQAKHTARRPEPSQAEIVSDIKRSIEQLSSR